MVSQVNKGHAQVTNIENQNIYFSNTAGTAFVPGSECREGKYYESVKDALYYPSGYLEQAVCVLEAEHGILIQGEQGSGKSVLAFHLAHQMKQQGIIASEYYLSTPSDWNTIRQYIQTVHCRDKESCSEAPHLWIIDNLHRIAGAAMDFPDASFWGRDYGICCTRDLNSLPDEKESWMPPALSEKQKIKRSIDKVTFLKCCHVLADSRMGRHESDRLYQYIGGNLAMLRYIAQSGNLPRTFADWENEQFLNFDNIYINYFGREKARQVTRDNLMDVLRMLFLSQIDFSIPYYLQGSVCGTVLRDLYFETPEMELEMEHVSLAELLTACICSKYKLDDRCIFADCLHWALSNLTGSSQKETEQIRQMNRFLQALTCYQFVLHQNQTLHEILFEDEIFSEFLESHSGMISLSAWKGIMELAKGDSGVNAVFLKFAKSPQLLETMKLNGDYDFRFFRDFLSGDDLREAEAMLLSQAEAVRESVLESGNEVCLMHLLFSFTEKPAVRFLEDLQPRDLVKILCGNKNGLFLYARYYSWLGDEVKHNLGAKLSMDDYREIFMGSATVCGFACLLAAASEPLRQDMCSMLEKWPQLAEKLVEKTVQEGSSIGALNLSLRELKKESEKALETFESAVGISGYEKLLEKQGTIMVLAQLMRYSTPGMRGELAGLLGRNAGLAEELVEKTVQEGSSIGTLDLSLRELKKESEEALEAFERAVGISGYEKLLEGQGTIAVLARLMQHSTSGMRGELSGLLGRNAGLAEKLVEKTVREGSSIGTLNLSLRDLKKESEEALEAFERAVGISGYEKLLEKQGTIMVLAKLMENSTPEMRGKLSDLLVRNAGLAEELVKKTVQGGSSIGTLNLSLRELKKESEKALEAFERAVGISGYEKLLEKQGTIMVLAKLIENSTPEMRRELSGLLVRNAGLAEELVEKTVQEGSSIGTLDLSLRELKKESEKALEAFERAVGISGYEKLLEGQGTIAVLARLMQYSTPGMRGELSGLLVRNAELAEKLVEKTVREGRSIGTLNLSLRELKKESEEALEAFERAVGTGGYKRLLEVKGTIPILMSLMKCSSPQMQENLADMLNSYPEFVKALVERTAEDGRPIGGLSISIRAIGKENDLSLSILENLIGAEGYLKMFSKCNANSIAILRIMACSSISDFLVDKMYANTDIWKESKGYISEESCTILKDFNMDLFYAERKVRKKFWGFVKDMVTAEEWLSWMKQGAILEEAVFIMRNLPLSMASNIADAWLEKKDEVMEGLRFVRQNRASIGEFDSKTVNRAIMAINNYNHPLYMVINEEYRALTMESGSSFGNVTVTAMK